MNLNIKDHSELTELLKKSMAAYNAMTPEQQEQMRKQQRESFVRAEMSWPKPKYHWEIRNGERCKVYHSWEDYCND